MIIVTDSTRNTAVRRSECDSIYLAEGKEGAQNRNYILVEELLHIHQMENNPGDFSNAKLNYEIEAKAGWVMYEFRQPGKVIRGKTYDGQLGEGGTIKFHTLIAICYNNPNRDTKDYNNTYEAAVNSLRTIGVYESEKLYPESKAHRTFSVLEELMKNCDEL